MGDKTEEPTAKRLREARKKGQVANSRDLTTALLFITAFSLLLGTGSSMVESLKEFMHQYLSWAVSQSEIPSGGYYKMGVDTIFTILKLVAPLFMGIFVISLFISYVQVGPLFSFEAMKPDLKKINPLGGMKKWFSPKTFVELLKTTIKLSAICFLAYQIVRDLLRPMVLSVGSNISNMNIFLKDMVSSFTFRVAAVFIVVAAADFFYQKQQWKKGLKMSKDEVKREYKEDEGDPMYKHKRKEMHQEFAFNSMMKNTRKATVVVVNPTHLAVALFYDREIGGAPQVLAKGQNLIADQIRKIAKEEGIPIMRNVTLAQALNKVEIGDVIPEELYYAVADVLNYVYRLGQQGRR
jgi:flagellar biosynthesis protein FlhB